MKKKAILIIHGEGGHRAQMQKLLRLLSIDSNKCDITFVGLHENNDSLKEIESYSLFPLRDKYSSFNTLVTFPKNLYRYFTIFKKINTNYTVLGVVSTGPGIAILPSLYYKARGKKIIFLETWSRFESQSIAGKIMYRISNKFYIQNKEQQKFYPKAIYGGLL